MGVDHRFRIYQPGQAVRRYDTPGKFFIVVRAMDTPGGVVYTLRDMGSAPVNPTNLKPDETQYQAFGYQIVGV